MDSENPVRVRGDGIAQRHGPRIYGQLLKNGSSTVAGKTQEDHKKKDKPVSFSFHK
jgi:hypothetical protein